MNVIQKWLMAVRAPFFTATAVPACLGAAIAWFYGNFSLPLFLLTILGVVFLHAGTNLMNDYYDHVSTNDEINKHHNTFSGGSRVIQEKILSANEVFWGASLCFFLGSICGLYLNTKVAGNLVLYLGLFGVICGVLYTARPVQIVYRGFGEFVVGLNFGPLVVLGAYYVQANNLNHLTEIIVVSLPVALLITAVLYINEFPDYEADKQVHKNTLVVLLGREKAIVLYYALMALTYLMVIVSAMFAQAPYFILIALVTVPLALKGVSVARNNFDDPAQLIPACASTVGAHLTTGLLLSGGYIIATVVKLYS